MPFTLGVGLLSRVFGGLGNKIGAQAMLIAGPAGAALAYVWMALGQEASLMLGVLGSMSLLGLSFAGLVASLTASVMSSVDQTGGGSHQASSRIAQLAGVALATGIASFASGYEAGLIVAAVTSIGGAFTASITLTPAAAKAATREGLRKHGIQPDSIFPKLGRHP